MTHHANAPLGVCKAEASDADLSLLSTVLRQPLKLRLGNNSVSTGPTCYQHCDDSRPENGPGQGDRHLGSLKDCRSDKSELAPHQSHAERPRKSHAVAMHKKPRQPNPDQDDSRHSKATECQKIARIIHRCTAPELSRQSLSSKPYPNGRRDHFWRPYARSLRALLILKRLSAVAMLLQTHIGRSRSSLNLGVSRQTKTKHGSAIRAV